MIVNDWQYVRLDEIVRVGSGQVSPKAKPYCDYLLVGPENIESGNGTLRDLKSASEAGAISGKYLFDEEAIIYSKVRPNLNKVCVPGFKGLCSADAYPLWVDESIVDKYFLAHTMRSEDFVKQAVATSMRSGMPKINRNDLAGLTVRLPCLPEQQAIIAILDDADAAVRTADALIQMKKKYKDAIAERLLMRPDWSETRLGELFRERVEAGRPDLRLLSVTGANGIVTRDTLAKRDTSSEDKSRYRRVCPGDIAYNTMRMWQGVFGLSNVEGIVSPAYTVCTPCEGVHGPFMAQMFKLPSRIVQFHRHSQGLVDDTLNLKYTHFAQIRVRVPDFPTQQRIAECLGLMDDEIALLRQQRDALREQKRGLMQLLLTGEKRVKGFMK